jgi:hypothetical protein
MHVCHKYSVMYTMVLRCGGSEWLPVVPRVGWQFVGSCTKVQIASFYSLWKILYLPGSLDKWGAMACGAGSSSADGKKARPTVSRHAVLGTARNGDRPGQALLFEDAYNSPGS